MRFIMKFVEIRHNLQVEWGSGIAKDIHHPPAGRIGRVSGGVPHHLRRGREHHPRQLQQGCGRPHAVHRRLRHPAPAGDHLGGAEEAGLHPEPGRGREGAAAGAGAAGRVGRGAAGAGADLQLPLQHLLHQHPRIRWGLPALPHGPVHRPSAGDPRLPGARLQAVRGARGGLRRGRARAGQRGVLHGLCQPPCGEAAVTWPTY